MKKPNAQLADQLTESRIDILRNVEFISIFFLNMDIYEAEESEYGVIKTAATAVLPTPYIIINPKFWSTLTRKQRNFVLLHEVLHQFFEHHGRQVTNNYNHKIYNIATDFVINAYGIEIMSGDKKSVLEPPKEILYDKQYSGWTSDKVYHKLLQDDDGNADKVIERYNGDSNSGDGKGDAPLDSVGSEAMSEIGSNQMKQEIAAGINIAETNSNSMGSGMANVLRMIKDLLEPQIHWTSLLQEFVVKACNTHHTYNRLSRKRCGSIVFPSTTGDTIRLLYGCDSSGSMGSKDLKEASTELMSICESFESWSVEFITCDTVAHVVGEYNSGDGDDFEDIDLSFKGGGGTSMLPMLEHANDCEFEPDVCVIVTDGHIPTEELNDNIQDIPLIVIVTSDGNKELKLSDDITVIHMN